MKLQDIIDTENWRLKFDEELLKKEDIEKLPTSIRQKVLDYDIEKAISIDGITYYTVCKSTNDLDAQIASDSKKAEETVTILHEGKVETPEVDEDVVNYSNYVIRHNAIVLTLLLVIAIVLGISTYKTDTEGVKAVANILQNTGAAIVGILAFGKYYLKSDYDRHVNGLIKPAIKGIFHY